MVLRPRGEEGADLAQRIKGGLGRLVGDQLDGGDQADAAHLAHQGMPGEAAQAVLQPRRHRADVADDVALLVDLQRLKRQRSEEHTSELQSLMRISYAVFRLQQKNKETNTE